VVSCLTSCSVEPLFMQFPDSPSLHYTCTNLLPHLIHSTKFDIASRTLASVAFAMENHSEGTKNSAELKGQS
jgi:hypothetical protein